ncbi:hypothetical protein JCM5296_002433 [Sporobolomyces johnsonii]
MAPVLRTRSGPKNGPPTPYTKPEPRAKPASPRPTPSPVPVPQVRKRSRDDADNSVDESRFDRRPLLSLDVELTASLLSEQPAATSRKVRPLPKKEVKNTTSWHRSTSRKQNDANSPWCS